MDFLDPVLDVLRLPLDGYRWLVRQSVVLARDLFVEYGYYVVFFGVCLENLLFLGLFIPGILILLLAGISAYQGLIEWPLAAFLGIAGASIGDTASYCMGRFGWKRALDHMQRVPWMGTMQTALRRRPAIFVLAYHFMGYTRLVGPIMAGAVRIPFWRWYLLDLLSATLFVGFYLGLGYFFGSRGFTLDTAEDSVRRLEWLIAVGVVIAIAASIYSRRRQSGPPAILEALAEPVGGEAEPTAASQTEEVEPARKP